MVKILLQVTRSAMITTQKSMQTSNYNKFDLPVMCSMRTKASTSSKAGLPRIPIFLTERPPPPVALDPK